MTTEKHDPLALLREARDFVERAAHILEDDGYYADAQVTIARIDAALAAHDAVPPSEEKVDSATPVVEWEQSHWMTYFNGFRIQVYPSRLDGGWWEFLVERDVHDPNERLIGQGTSKQAAMRGGIQAVKEWK